MPLATPTTLGSSLALTTDMVTCLDTEPSATVDTTVVMDMSDMLAMPATTTASVMPTLMPMPTLLVRSLTAFPSTTRTPPATLTTLASSLVWTTATDVSLATEPSETVASMVDSTMEPTLDTPVPTMVKFTLSNSSHHYLLKKLQLLRF